MVITILRRKSSLTLDSSDHRISFLNKSDKDDLIGCKTMSLEDVVVGGSLKQALGSNDKLQKSSHV